MIIQNCAINLTTVTFEERLFHFIRNQVSRG
jgi:hypothetical protein